MQKIHSLCGSEVVEVRRSCLNSDSLEIPSLPYFWATIPLPSLSPPGLVGVATWAQGILTEVCGCGKAVLGCV